MNEQINLLGAPDAPEDLELGVVQREVMRFLRRIGTITADEAGAVAHAHSGKHQIDERCAFCAIDGKPILVSLLRRGRVERGAEGAFQLPRARR